MNKLLEALKVRQVYNKMTDAQFSSSLGVSRGTWSLVRAGKVKMNIPILKGILLSYPDMQSKVVDYIIKS